MLQIFVSFLYLMAICHIRAKDCATSDAFKMGEVEEIDLDEVKSGFNK